MINLNNQENHPEIRKLREILQSVPKETKQDNEWQLLENELFASMDEIEKDVSKNSKMLSWRDIVPFLPGNISAIGAVATLIIILGFGIFYSGNLFSPKPLIHSRILGVKGNVTYKKLDIYKSLPVYKNQIFETAVNATLIVQLDKGSNIILSEKTRLIVNKANSRDIELFINRGNVLASVSKRERNQTFTILTSDATCRVIGTIFSITVSQNNNKSNTDLTVLEGEVSISDKENPKIHEIVKSGQTASIQNSNLSKPYTAAKDQISNHSLLLLKLALEMSNEMSISKGLLDITSKPSGAKIFIRDKLIGKTPMAFNYPAGDYNLKLLQPGYKTWQEMITLKKLSSSFVYAEFVRKDDDNVLAFQPTPSCKRVKRIKRVKQVQQIQQIQQVQTEEIEQKVDSLSKTKDFGFIMNPAFVEALVQMTIGEYQRALMILDSLKELPEISITEKIRIMSKISACYKGIGNFENSLKSLTKRYNNTESSIDKRNLLWEIINVKANCLQDYAGAEQDILTYINNYPDGTWIESAYAKLGEIQYITGKYSKAVGTFQYHINLFGTSNVVENSIYTLANIMRMDIKDYTMAIKWYTKLLKEYPSSIYYGNALFERAECYEKQKQHAKARKDYKKYLELYPEGHLKMLCSSRLSSQE